jgi:hypothetical protein
MEADNRNIPGDYEHVYDNMYKEIEVLKAQANELRQRLNDGRNYLMGVEPSDLNATSALIAFGYNSRGYED